MTPAALAALHSSAFTTPRAWTEAEFQSLLTGAGIFVLGDARGFVMGRAIAGEAEVLTLAVAPVARRQGIARALMLAFEARAQATAAETAFLEVATNNDPAVALYLSLGYRQSGRRRGYFSAPDGTLVDALVMSKPLQAIP